MIYVILGRREQGKTTLGLYLTRKYPVRALFDPRGLMPTADRVTAESDVRLAFDELIVDATTPHGDITITPSGPVQPMFEKTSAQVRRWIQLGRGSIAYLVDELRFVDSRTTDFEWLCRCATRAEVAIVVTAHRPSDVPTDLRAIADIWCVFQTTQQHDLDAIEDRTSEAFAGKVKALQPRYFLVWDDTRGQMLGPSIVPADGVVKLVGGHQAVPVDLGLPETVVDKDRLFD